MTDFEQLEQESCLWPWLDSDFMSDPGEEDFFDEVNLFEEDEDHD